MAFSLSQAAAASSQAAAKGVTSAPHRCPDGLELRAAYSDGVQEEAPKVWQATLQALNTAGVPAPQRAFLAQASLVGMLKETALIAVPDEFTKDIVETLSSRGSHHCALRAGGHRGAAGCHRRPVPASPPGG